MSVDLSQFHQIFFEESFENLDAMETQLMALDPAELDDETINSIFRAAHSIKGGAGTFGFSVIADFTHLLETLLDEVRSGKRGINQEEIDLYLQSVDCLREIMQSCQQGEEVDPEKPRQLSGEFERLLQLKPSDQNQEEPPLEESVNPVVNCGWEIRFKPAASLLRSGNEPLRMFRVLAELGELTVNVMTEDLPQFESLVPEQCHLSWLLKLGGDVTREQIDEVFEWVADEAEIYIQQRQQSEPVQTETGSEAWQIGFIPNKEIFLSGNDPLRLLRELCNLGSSQVLLKVPQLPAFEQYNPEQCYLAWQVQLETNSGRTAIEEVFEWVVDDAEIHIQNLNTATDATVANNTMANNTAGNSVRSSTPDIVEAETVQIPRAPSTGPANKKPATKIESSSIRVAIDKIDNLINMVGELVITQSMLGQIGGEFALEKLPRLLEGLSQLEHNTRELQESVMRIRMLPISFAFSRFPRMVRDLGRRLDKQIELVLHGEQTELDKTVMERIGDPLVHLVRNAIDHGVEVPQERQQVGKPAQGKITLNAYHQSGNVIIEIIDDGRGINREKLLEKARKQGLLSEAESQALSDGQAYDFIFHPGLSTAAEVSDVSGRGVGMDVVKRNIQELNGSVDIKSQDNVGTTITIRLPLTLAILDGQLVRVGTNIYIFPLVSIVESMQIKNEQLSKVAGGCEVFQLRDEYIPVVRLYEIFHVKPDSTDIEDSLLVVVEADGEKIGVVVDELSAQQQVVIKSLEQNYERIEGVSGATILGDGTVSLILDIPGIVKLSGAHQVSVQNLIHRTENVPLRATN